jgi:ArsR family transcriptional regulator
MEKELLNILKALADESRLRILCLLNRKDLCVCEIEAVLKTSQSNISRHLTKLKDRGLIISEKQAQFVIHKINKEMTEKYPFILTILNQASKVDKYKSDLENLKDMKVRGMISCKSAK